MRKSAKSVHTHIISMIRFDKFIQRNANEYTIIKAFLYNWIWA